MPSGAGNLAVMRSALVGVTDGRHGEGRLRRVRRARSRARPAPRRSAAQPAEGRPRRKDDYALFAGYAPADAPRYAVAVVIEQGGHGGSVAAPAAREVLAQLNGLPVVHVTSRTSRGERGDE